MTVVILHEISGVIAAAARTDPRSASRIAAVFRVRAETFRDSVSAGAPSPRVSELGGAGDEIEVEAVGQRRVPVAGDTRVADDPEEEDEDGCGHRPRRQDRPAVEVRRRWRNWICAWTE